MTSKTVIAVSRNKTHSFSKPTYDRIQLEAGLGVVGDAHNGETVKHRSRVAKDPTQPNLRQVHLIHHELIDDLNASGFTILPGNMGENMTTRGIDLLGLATGTKLHIGDAVTIEVTGLRNPCVQLDNFQAGLMSALVSRDEAGDVLSIAGVFGIVLRGGTVYAGDEIKIEKPAGVQRPLEKV